MDLIFLNQTKTALPKKQLKELSHFLDKKLGWSSKGSLTVIFLGKTSAKKLNLQYRGKNYATDVLSFSGDDECFGELVFCPDVLKKQAREHGLSFKSELNYLFIHGVLHLLGYDHERSEKEAQRMFRIQDKLFEEFDT